MKKQNLTLVMLLTLCSALLSVPASARTTLESNASASAPPINLVVRALTGPIFYSKTEPVKDAWGTALQIGMISENGFGLIGIGKFNFEGNGGMDTWTNDSVYTTMNSFGFLIEPNYTYKKGITSMTFGMGFGGMIFRTKSYESSSGGGAGYSEESNQAFGLAPRMGIDFSLFSAMTASISIDTFAALGAGDKIVSFQPMAGLGYRF
jgi:hypothetical protein